MHRLIIAPLLHQHIPSIGHTDCGIVLTHEMNHFIRKQRSDHIVCIFISNIIAYMNYGIRNVIQILCF